MKRIVAILTCLLLASTPSLSMAASMATAESAHECGGCACGAEDCCATNSGSTPAEQPAVPAHSSTQQLSAGLLHATGNPIILPPLPVLNFGATADSSSFSFPTPLYARNCALLI